MQMPSPNAFFPHTIESEGRRKQLGQFLVRLHRGRLANAMRAGAALDPTTGLAGSLVTGKTARAALPEWEVVSEPEPWEDSYLSGALFAQRTELCTDLSSTDPVESPEIGRAHV